jgi:phytoene synthase
MSEFKKDINYCKRFLKKHGKSYYFATQLFPAKLRQATYALYAFVRVPDEYVDNQDRSREKLQRFKKAWCKAYREQRSPDPVLRATAATFHKYKIPFKYSIDFLEAMAMDTYKKRYKNFAELKKYMYGSAAVVGLMMSYIIGFRNKKALKYAENLGYAMQLTNFLRDIGEDYFLRNRIYLPQDELKRFGIKEKDFSAKKLNNDFVRMLKYNIERAKKYYVSAERGIKHLKISGRKAVRVALVLYREILAKIELNNYDVFNKRAHTSFFEKINLTIGALYD